MHNLFSSLLLALLLVASGDSAIHGPTENGDLSEQQPTVVEVDLQKESLASFLASAQNERLGLKIQSLFSDKLDSLWS